MNKTTENIVFPYLIYRNENQVNWDMSNLERKRADTAKDANQFRDDFIVLIGKFTLDSFIAFLEMDAVTAQKWLLAPQMKRAEKIGIREDKRLDFIIENFDLPKHDHLLLQHRYFSKHIEEIRAMFDEATTTFKPIVISKAEREAIEKKHSKYVYNQREYGRYIAYKKLYEACEYLMLSREIHHTDGLGDIVFRYGKFKRIEGWSEHAASIRELDYNKF